MEQLPQGFSSPWDAYIKPTSSLHLCLQNIRVHKPDTSDFELCVGLFQSLCIYPRNPTAKSKWSKPFKGEGKKNPTFETQEIATHLVFSNLGVKVAKLHGKIYTASHISKLLNELFNTSLISPILECRRYKMGSFIILLIMYIRSTTLCLVIQYSTIRSK